MRSTEEDLELSEERASKSKIKWEKWVLIVCNNAVQCLKLLQFNETTVH